MGFCQKCGEIVRNTSGICEACKTTSVESAASGMTASGNQGDGYSNKYLSSGLNAGVEKGIRRMLGEDPGVKEECIDCGRKLEKESEVFVGPSEKGGHVYW
ncbi:hypothetical protein BJ742DRAFT_797891 [Cladochytrium replicatum]|nr:hypothetical protein BJ742DRAFT_797891 [Cladochytrium replicatum]